MYVHRPLVALAVHVPDLVHQLTARENLVRIRQQLKKKQKLLLRQFQRSRRRGYRHGIVLQGGRTDRQFPLPRNARPPQERGNAQNHFFLVHGLDHVVVRTNDKAALLVLGGLARRHHQNRQHTARLPKRIGKFIAVHARHHHIQQNQVNMGLVQNRQRFLTVPRSNRLIAVTCQNRRHQLSCIGIILNHQNPEHLLIPFRCPESVTQDCEPYVNNLQET